MAERVEEGPEEEAQAALDQASPAAVAVAMGRTGRGEEAVDAEAASFLRDQRRLINLQAEHLHEQRQLQLAHLHVRRWKDRLSLAAQALAVVVGAAVLVGLGVAAWQAHEDQSLVIEAFSTPPAFAQQGLSGPALSGELMDRLAAINRVVRQNSITAASGVKADPGDDIKLEIPETGISIGEVGRLLREWLGRQHKVEGELRQAGDGKLLLIARMDGQAFTASGAPADLDKLEQQVAEQIFAASDESNYVIYLDAAGRRLEALAEARRMAQAQSEAIPLWATEEHELDPVASLPVARLAARLEPLSPFSHWEQMRAEWMFGHDEAALASARRLLAILKGNRPRELQAVGGDSMQASTQWIADRLQGDYAAAQAAWERFPAGRQLPLAANAARLHDLRHARDLLALASRAGAPEDADMARARAAIAAEAGDWAAAATAAAAAVDRDRAAHADDPIPGGAAGFAQVEQITDGPLLAEARARSGDFVGAEAALAGAPSDCDACLRARGRIAALQKDWPAAERWFAQAVRQAPSIPLGYADWGAMLLAKGDVDGAIAKLQAAHAAGPHYADTLELWGEALVRKGDFAGAAAKFAEVDGNAPRWGRNHLERGEALMLAGRYAEARRQFETASGLDLSAPDRAALNVLLVRTASGPLHG